MAIEQGPTWAPGSIQDQVTAYWDARGPIYDAQPRHGLLHEREKDAWLATLRDLLLPPPQDVLDVGTGTGFLALLLAELGYRVIGLDLSEGMLATARAKAMSLRPAPQFLVGDAINPPLPPASVDVVANRHVLWTLLDPISAFRNWRRLLRPGGRVVVIDSLWPLDHQAEHTIHPGYSEEISSAMPLRRVTSTEQVVAVARAAGLAVARVTTLEEIARIESEVLPPSNWASRTRYALVATAAG